MARNPLSSAVADHGTMPITLDDFAAIVGATPAALRGRRDRDKKFPAPINTDASPLTYFLRELADWWIQSDLANPDAVDPVATAWWHFTATFEQCSARHGAEATRRLVAGAALLLCERRPPELRPHDSELLTQLRDHATSVEPRFADVAVRSGDFQPDAIPATDREFLSSLISWSGSAHSSRSSNSHRRPRIPEDSPIASQLLVDLRNVRKECRRQLGRDQKLSRREMNQPFIDLVEPLIRGLARDIATRPSSSDLGLTRLMVSIVDPQPGEVVVDLACGQGSTFIEAMRSAQPTQRSTQVIGCIGRERDELVWTIAKIRLGLRDIAHDLGQPSNGLDCELEPRPTHRFITDPGMRIPQLRKWMRRHVDLLETDAVAVLAVPAASVFRPNPGRSWRELQTEIDSVVFTPTETAVIVLRHEAPAWKTLVQIHRMTAAMAERRYREHAESIGVEPLEELPLEAFDPAIEPFMPTQIRRVAEQISGRASSGSTDRKPPEGEDDFVQWRPIRVLTLEALGEPRFGDCSAIRDAVPAPDPEPVPAQQPAVRTDPPEPRRRSSRDRVVFAALRDAEKGENTGEDAIARQARELEAQALEAVKVLRWLLDPTTLREGAWNGPLSPKVNGALEELGTEEMRRALRRLQLRLLGEETRGRRATDDSKPESGSDTPVSGEEQPKE